MEVLGLSILIFIIFFLIFFSFFSDDDLFGAMALSGLVQCVIKQGEVEAAKSLVSNLKSKYKGLSPSLSPSSLPLFSFSSTLFPFYRLSRTPLCPSCFEYL